MKVATWNVNGVRAREGQVREWLARERPDVVCLQELKAAADQVPVGLDDEYWSCWHAATSYSGVGLLLRRDAFPEKPAFGHPPFDFEHRIVTARVGDLLVASVYVPNGGKDFAAKLRFLEALEPWVTESRAVELDVVLCGDLNVTRAEIDVHPKERKADAIGQRPEERDRLERLLARGLTDLGRALDPANEGLFTWWAPWRNHRPRNIGWRLDYVLASEPLARRAVACPVQAGVGTSDHAPVVATFEWPR
ncbi:MAG: exodeoxyribonuclease III [Candidatus Rokubacteria bacterium]|nr:exodeoxyribonuclease III [Candidatus Rokubacteria bacterium]